MTYFLTAISLEQQRLQKILDDFKNHIQNVQAGISTKMQDHYFQSLDVTIKNFYQVEKQCQERKVNMYLIPAIHETTKPADEVLAELEFLKSNSVNLFMEMQQQIGSCFDKGVTTMAELCNAMQRYCDMQQTILSKEEKELLPMAQQSLPFDVWFTISAKCLADQENSKDRERAKTDRASEKKFPKGIESAYVLDMPKQTVQHATT
jgi:hypothetical protein